MVLRRTARVRLITLALMLGACSGDDSDSHAKDAPDATAIEAGHARERDAGGQSGHHTPDAGARDAGALPMQSRTDGGATSDASVREPAHDAATPNDDDAGGVVSDCNATLPSSIELETRSGSALLIFDRSFSMADDWNGTPRWQAAGNAVISALTPLQDLLDVGVILFPSATPLPTDVGLDCAVDAFDSTEQIAFQPAATVLQKLQGPAPKGTPSPMYAPIGSGNSDPAVGATPTTEAVDQANAVIAKTTFAGSAVVVLITDGEPNCQWDQTHTTDLIAAWRSAYHIDTHVMLLPTTTSAGGQPSMAIPVGQALAAAGGTTLVQSNNAATLQQTLSAAISRSLVQALKSCSIDLEVPVTPPRDVQLVVSERGGEREAAAHDLGHGSGWTITKDGTHVELTGALCEDAKRGRFEAIELAYGCASLPPVDAEAPSCPAAGTAYCSGTCIDVTSDESNCGACGQKCGSGLTCCIGQCVDTTFDANDCGACGNVCTGLCCAGQCKADDANNCGSCDTMCGGDTPCCCQGQCYALPQVGTCAC